MDELNNWSNFRFHFISGFTGFNFKNQNESKYQFFLYLNNLGKKKRKLIIFAMRWCCLEVNIFTGHHPIFIILRFPAFEEWTYHLQLRYLQSIVQGVRFNR